MVWLLLGAFASVFLLLLGATWWQIRQRNMQRWLPVYLRDQDRYQPIKSDEEVHVLLCFADHYEPKAGGADKAAGMKRVAVWVDQFPQQFARFKDSDGRSPRYTFFFPAEEYEPEYLDALAQLCRAGFGEVELHLHHDNDTAEGFREKLIAFREILVNRHGLLSRKRDSGEVMFGFIHGNWALCNSRPDGRWCGVNNEIAILLEAGCYADFTFPSAPDATQPPIINRIYHASDRPGETCSHETMATPPAPPCEGGKRGGKTLLMVQGPLLLDWGNKKWGVFPGIENACIQSSQPPTIERLKKWLQARVRTPNRPDWFFVKLHAHGAPEHDHEPLLGAPMVQFHEGLATLAHDNPKFHFHYVTAREMANLIKAAEAGYEGPVNEALDWELVSNIRERRP